MDPQNGSAAEEGDETLSQQQSHSDLADTDQDSSSILTHISLESHTAAQHSTESSPHMTESQQESTDQECRRSSATAQVAENRDLPQSPESIASPETQKANWTQPD